MTGLDGVKSAALAPDTLAKTFCNCDPGTSSFSVAWKLVRDTDSEAVHRELLQMFRTRHSEPPGPATCDLQAPPPPPVAGAHLSCSIAALS